MESLYATPKSPFWTPSPSYSPRPLQFDPLPFRSLSPALSPPLWLFFPLLRGVLQEVPRKSCRPCWIYLSIPDFSIVFCLGQLRFSIEASAGMKLTTVTLMSTAIAAGAFVISRGADCRPICNQQIESQNCFLYVLFSCHGANGRSALSQNKPRPCVALFSLKITVRYEIARKVHVRRVHSQRSRVSEPRCYVKKN